MKAMKILVVVVALVAITGMVTDAWAQCSGPRIFRSSGKGGLNVKADTTGAESGGNEIGRLWDTQNAAFSNNGLADGSQCTPDNWWRTDGTLWYIDGALTSGACAQTGCPTRDMTVVIEDYDTNGPPGVGGKAFYMGWAVTETPAGLRWYDYGLVDGVTAATTLPFLQFPSANVLDSDRSPGTVDVTMRFADQAGNVHSWLNGAVAPTTAVVKEWHLMKATGTADPGRQRSLWTKIDTIAHQDGGLDKFYSVDCPDVGTDEWLAIGIGFDGGSAPAVDSALVGEAVALECDPTLAQPDEVKPNLKPVPGNTELQPKQRQSGRR